MKKIKKLLSSFILISMTACLASGCEKTENTDDADKIESASDNYQGVTLNNSVDSIEASEYFKEFDLSTDYKDVTADIQLNEDDVKITGKNAVYTDKKVSITSGGTYVISGKLNDGQIYVNSEDDENVHIIFNSVNINNSTSSPVYIENAKNTAITLVEGTENILADSQNYEYDSSDQNEHDSVIFSNDDLSFNGSGVLNITANYNEAITTKNDLRIAGGQYNITAPGNGIKGKESVVIRNADINITSGEDGIKSSETEKTDKGFIVFESGKFNIEAMQDAVQSENFLIINGGDFNIKTDGTTENSNNNPTENSSDISYQNNSGFGRFGKGKGAMEGNPNKTEDSEKGFKSSKTITINAGTVTADCKDDCIHAAGDVEINNGTLLLNTKDDAVHSDGNVTVNGGNINIENSYEGIEGIVININGGDIKIKSDDDGLNAGDGTGGDMMSGSPSCQLNFNGGSVYVDAGGDGLDSNGSMNINDGTIIVDGPVNDGNGALDSGTDIIINGGILVAAGSSGMAETPSEISKQNSIAAAFSQSKSALTLVYVTDENDKVIVAYKPSKEYSSVIISTPEIEKGKEYKVYSGGNAENITEYQFNSNVKCSGGELVEAITVSEAVSLVGDCTFGMGGRGMNHGDFGDGGRTQHGDFSEDMTPPDGDFEDMAPHGGFKGMTPHDGNFDNMTPPDGGFRGMIPPDNGGIQSPQNNDNNL